MAAQMSFYRKNYVDISYDYVTVSEQSSLQETGLDQMRDRSNNTAWITSGSNDAETLNIVWDLVDSRDIDTIVLVGHNLKSFVIQYDVASVWTNFSTPINETTNASSTNVYTFNTVNTSKIRITITGTQVVDAEKKIQQFIITEALGQLEAYPEIKSAKIDQNIQSNQVVSGKRTITRNTGGFSFAAEVRIWNVQTDIDLIESLYLTNQSFLVWISSGDEAQFSLKNFGYRAQDIFLMRTSDLFTPNFYKGLYQSGFVLSVGFQEVIN